MKKTVLTAILAIATATVAMAQAGENFKDSNSGLYFRVISTSPNEVEVYNNNYNNYTSSNCSRNSITIPTSVTYNGVTYSVTAIGERAFYECSSLASINIPNSVTKIGDEAFRGCKNLTSIEIPNSVTGIGNGAF
ncbi:MAG: leucine-rich repeat domain-containing protein, partial [Porphyromonadaceae bacterium]|nr:leucine-rich repeat domain-containing protein [Porphyromonadaceae bacterium]